MGSALELLRRVRAECGAADARPTQPLHATQSLARVALSGQVEDSPALRNELLDFVGELVQPAAPILRRDRDVTIPVPLDRLRANLAAMQACALLGSCLPLPPGDVFRLAALGSAAMGIGEVLLQLLSGKADVTWEAHTQSSVVCSVLGRLLRAGSEEPHPALAAAASSTFKPPFMVFWLDILSEWLTTGAWRPVSKPARLKALTNLVSILHIMRSSGAAFQPHWAALAANAAARKRLARCLATCCLPELAAAHLACSDASVPHERFATLRELGMLLAHPILEADVSASLDQPPAVVLLRHSANALQRLAAQQAEAPAAGPPLHLAASRADELLWLAAHWVADPSGDSGGGNSSSSATTSGSSCGDSGSSSGSSSSSSSGGGRGASPERRVTLEITDATLQAAWVMAELLPAAAAVLRRMAADPSCPADGIFGLCHNLFCAVTLLRQLKDQPASPAQLAAWASAADAGLRLQPLLAQLNQQLEQPRQRLAVQQLSLTLIEDVWRCAPLSPVCTSGEGEAAWQQLDMISGATARPGARLVLSGCRLAHWLAAGGELAGWGGRLSAASCAMLQGAIAESFRTVAMPLWVQYRGRGEAGRGWNERFMGDGDEYKLRRMEGMCCSTWAAIQALADAMEHCPPTPVPAVGARVPRPPSPAWLVGSLTNAMMLVMTFSPEYTAVAGAAAFVRPVRLALEAAGEASACEWLGTFSGPAWGMHTHLALATGESGLLAQVLHMACDALLHGWVQPSEQAALVTPCLDACTEVAAALADTAQQLARPFFLCPATPQQAARQGYTAAEETAADHSQPCGGREGSGACGSREGSEASEASAGSGGSGGSPLPVAAAAADAAAGSQLELSDGSRDEAEVQASPPAGELGPAESQLAGMAAAAGSLDDFSCLQLNALRMQALTAVGKRASVELRLGDALLSDAPVVLRASALCHLAPAVQEVALLVGQLHRLPVNLETYRLAHARAVATRPCANLACPNLAAAEQEAAGVRHACRAARYCSPECARVAWKAGGHRLVCAALAAGAAEPAAQGAAGG